MQADDPQSLVRRVTELESELRMLRRRVAALEGVEFVETPPPTAIAPAPATAVASVAPRAPVVPPPLPPMVAAEATQPQRSVPERPPQFVGTMPAPAAPIFRQPAAVPAVPLPPPPPSALHELLDALHLLPPSGKKAGEAGVGAWWATRIGAMIFVIGIVFFGVFVSRGTPPWVKWLELATIAGAVTLAGLWIERKVERLGAVIMGSGLALCFFTAFAAYAVPAVKVIESIALGAVVQAAAVLVIGGVALWRRSSTVGTMAVLLGFVSAFFSFAEGFDDFAVVAGLGLSTMAVFFRWREGWAPPVFASSALVHVLNTLVAVEIWDTQVGERSPWLMFAVIAAAFAIHFGSLVIEGADERRRIATVQRWIQALNTSLAVLSGLVVGLVALQHDNLSWYFFGAAAVLLGASAWAWRTVPEDGIFAMFAVKATSLVALGVITEWDARTRWVALLVQAAVVMAAAVRTRRRSLAVTAVVAWLVSLAFFADDIAGLKGALVSSSGVAVLVYVLGSAALLAWTSTWLEARTEAQASGGALRWILGCGAALPVGLAVGAGWIEPWAAAACVLVSLALMVVARVLRSLVPVVGSILVIAAAHVLVQVFDETTWGLGWLWAGAGLVAVRSATLAWMAGARSGESQQAWRAAAQLLGVLSLVAIAGATMQTIAVYPALAVAAGLALAVVIVGRQVGRPDLVGAGLFGFPAVWVLHVYHRFGYGLDPGGVVGLWLAAATVPVALAVRPQPASGANRAGAVAGGLAAGVGVVLAWAAAEKSFGVVGLAWSVVAVAAAYLAVGYWRRCATAHVAASVLLALGAFHVTTHNGWVHAPGAWIGLLATLVLMISLAIAPLVGRRQIVWSRPEFERTWRAAHAVVATLGICLTAIQGHAVWSAYGSVVWALGGVVLFVLGMVLRARSHRIAGLVALGLCVPRVFIYDIQSIQYRIAAFVVLGVLLLVVGFSYQKFRYLVEGEKHPGGADKDTSEPGKTPPAP